MMYSKNMWSLYLISGNMEEDKKRIRRNITEYVYHGTMSYERENEEGKKR